VRPPPSHKSWSIGRGKPRVRLRAEAEFLEQRLSGAKVLVSSTVRELVAGSGLEFEDRGEHELKGVPGSWRLHAAKRPAQEDFLSLT
jgi:class 3 adenylate cyclase